MGTYWVDPLGTGSGIGTSGDPYADPQEMLDNTTQGGNGDVVFVRPGTYNLVGALDHTTYTAAGQTQPITWIGVDGSDNVDFTATKPEFNVGNDKLYATDNSYSGWNWINMYLHKTGVSASEQFVYGSAQQRFFGCNIVCDVEQASGVYLMRCGGVEAEVQECFLNGQTVGGPLLGMLGSNSLARGNMLVSDTATNNASNSIMATSDNCEGVCVSRNILVHDGSATQMKGVTLKGYQSRFLNNTLFHKTASASLNGIAVSNEDGFIIIGNYVEGFSTGFTSASNSVVPVYARNHFFDNDTDESKSGEHHLDWNNKIMASTGLAKSGAAVTWANRLTYYAPQDVDDMQAGGDLWGQTGLSVGAVQHVAAGGSGGGLAMRRTIFT